MKICLHLRLIWNYLYEDEKTTLCSNPMINNFLFIAIRCVLETRIYFEYQVQSLFKCQLVLFLFPTLLPRWSLDRIELQSRFQPFQTLLRWKNKSRHRDLQLLRLSVTLLNVTALCCIWMHFQLTCFKSYITLKSIRVKMKMQVLEWILKCSILI